MPHDHEFGPFGIGWGGMLQRKGDYWVHEPNLHIWIGRLGFHFFLPPWTSNVEWDRR